MLISIVEKFHHGVVVEDVRFSRWASAIQTLQEELEQGAELSTAFLVEQVREIPDDQQAGALEDLVAEYLRHSWQRGEAVLLEKVAEEIAGCGAELTISEDLVEDEFLARYQSDHGDRPDAEEYRRRFPGMPDAITRFESRLLAADRFVRLGLRGIGATARVWEAWDRETRKAVAIKEARTATDELIDLLAQEASVTVGLDVPGVARLEEFFPTSAGGTPFYTMPLAGKETLDQAVAIFHRREKRKQSLEALMATFVEICEIIAEVHRRGVIHCDLKSGNIGFAESGNALVFDWGMAIALHGAAPPHRDGSRRIAGSPAFMAPEQVAGEADVRSDVYGLGGVLYEMLTGQAPRPWQGGFLPHDWREQVESGYVERPRKLKSDAPRALEAICLKALACSPDDRYPDAAAMAADVARYLNGERVSAGGNSIWRRLRKKFLR